MNLLEVHTYDGKLKDQVKNINVSEDDKKDAINNFRKELKNTNSIRAFNIIYNSIGKPENHDTTNNIRAEDILYLLIKNLETISLETKKDILEILEYQLQDMVDPSIGGLCPQGRCTRIFQILFLF